MKNSVTITGRVYADGVLVSEQVITTAFLEMLVDAMQAETGQLDDFIYHHTGTGTTAATATDTALEIPISARKAGSQIEGASGVVYRTVAPITYSMAYPITEWGLFDALTGGNLLDRATFTAVAAAPNQTIQWTFDLTFAAA